MCHKLGKKHRHYTTAETRDAARNKKSHWKPSVRVSETYLYRILSDLTYLRELYWARYQYSDDVIKLSARKSKHYQKLEAYNHRASTGQ